MKKSVYVLCYIFFLSFVYGELINHNPDPLGEPWYSVDEIKISSDQLKRISQIPVMQLPESYKNKKVSLPYTVDNSLLRYFRPVFCQEGGSCAQASGVGYVFTYEQNFLKSTSADIPDNQYPTHYTYNFLNDGSGENGSWITDNWDIIASGGCPNVTSYGGMLWPSSDPETMNKIWMSGSEKYESGMTNRILEQLVIPVGTPSGLEVLKQWFIDHCDGSSAGGLAVFAAGVGVNIEIKTLSDDSYCPGESVVVKWDPLANHFMTFVGYNDSIRWDYNGDGKFTNNIDITGDGAVDMQDWEIGGVRMVNSWGDTWCDSGKSWVMYRTLAQSLDDGGISNNKIYTVRTKEGNKPKLKLKAKIDCSDRDDLKIMAGITKYVSASEPQSTIVFPYFSFQGGDSIGMSGDSSVIDLELDVSLLLYYSTLEEGATIFLSVVHKGDTEDIPTIRTFSVIDENGYEFVSDYIDFPVILNSTTHLGVNYPKMFKINNEILPDVFSGIDYTNTMFAVNGAPPYFWDLLLEYGQFTNLNPFPSETMEMLTMSSENDGYAFINLDFDFPYFGKKYNVLSISTNGSISFDTYKDVQTKDQLTKTVAIAPCVANLKLFTTNGDGIFYYKNADYVIIRWITSLYKNSKADLDFCAKLYSDGKIEFFYGERFTTGLSWSSGISNGSSQTTYYSNITTLYPSGQKTTFIEDPYPYGLELSSSGIFSGTLDPTSETEWNIIFRVTDSQRLTNTKELTLFLFDQEENLSEPLNVSVFKNESSAFIYWEKVSGASIYRIYRSTEPYAGFVEIGTSTTLSFEDTQAQNYDKCFYFVTAYNSFK